MQFRPIMLALGILLLGPVLNAQETQENMPGDAQIRDAIADKLLSDPGVRGHNIDVETEGRVATLHGTVSSLPAKRRAADIAAAMKGVMAVVNRLDVAPSEHSDATIAEYVRDALAETEIPLDNVRVEVDNGGVMLTGTVPSWPQRHLATTTAVAVKGVREVTNRLQVSGVVERPDAEIKADIGNALQDDRFLDADRIQIAVDEGKVTLRGSVDSAVMKGRARDDAWVRGVREVDVDPLEVAYGDDVQVVEREQRSPVADEAIAAAIRRALDRIPEVAPADVYINVADGSVTLRGLVDNAGVRRAVARAARNIAGVLRVRNRLQVRLAVPPNDAEIAARIRTALDRDPYVEPYPIEVRVHDGIVTLSGTVTTRFEKAQAEDIAALAEGVAAVNNHLAVVRQDIPLTYDPYVDERYPYDYPWNLPGGTTTAEDWEILDDILEAMRWSPVLDTAAIAVAVDEGVATLTGTVLSPEARMVAGEKAREGGAVRVINQLEIE